MSVDDLCCTLTHTVVGEKIMPTSKKSRTINEDPLDLSSGAGSIISGAGSSTEDDVDVLSIDPPSPSNVEHWSIEKVAEFVSNVESCREYAQVIKSKCILYKYV